MMNVICIDGSPYGFEVKGMESGVYKHIPELLDLARDTSEAGRLALVEKLSEVFLEQSLSLSRKEEELVNDLIEEILNNDNEALRHALIASFDKAVHASRAIAVRIGAAPIEIAKNVLVNNENLRDEDLVTIIKDQGDNHAAAIATRREVSEAVADALVTTGSMKVMQIVAENLGARLSPTAVDILVDTARLATMLQKPILSRPELPPEKALHLYWWVSKDLRRSAMERFGFGPGRLDHAKSDTVEQKLKTHIFEKDDDEAMKMLALWIEEREALSPALLSQLLRMNHYRLFNIVLSRMCELDLKYVDAIIDSAEPRLIVALCRNLSMDKGTFVSIFLMSRGGRNDEQVVNPRELSAALETFDKLSPDLARSMLATWRVNPEDLLQRAQSSSSRED